MQKLFEGGVGLETTFLTNSILAHIGKRLKIRIVQISERGLYLTTVMLDLIQPSYVRKNQLLLTYPQMAWQKHTSDNTVI